MKSTRQVMSTARGMALLRAAESARPAGLRVCFDPYARCFVNPLSLLAAGPFIRGGLPDRLFLGGAMSFAIARERYIDDLVIAEAGQGIEQIVLLGAGFDTRAYRIPEIVTVPLFEVDHPVTQASKREAVRGVVDPFPANVTFVPVDFDTDDLGEQLASGGYDEARRTLFVWQGVTMYLTPEGIDRTLAFIARDSGPRSVVVFDYVYRDGLTNAKSAGMRFVAAAMSERMTFGFEPDGIASFVAARGLTLVSDVDGAELSRRYFTGVNSGRPIAKDAAIVAARVAEQ